MLSCARNSKRIHVHPVRNFVAFDVNMPPVLPRGLSSCAERSNRIHVHPDRNCVALDVNMPHINVNLLLKNRCLDVFDLLPHADGPFLRRNASSQPASPDLGELRPEQEDEP